MKSSTLQSFFINFKLNISELVKTPVNLLTGHNYILVKSNLVQNIVSEQKHRPMIFKVKDKINKHKATTKQETSVNYAGKIKHHPPAVKE